MELLFTLLAVGLTPVFAVVVTLLFYPDKIEKWSALLWKLLSGFKRLFRNAHRHYVRYDIQGRVNGFTRRLRQEVPSIGDEKLQIQWINPAQKRSSFIDNGKIVLRLRRDDPADLNFVHGAYLFVSSSVLRKPKRYLSASQREALDLFVCSRLIQQEKETIIGTFIDEYLHPTTENTKSKIAILVDDFATIDEGGLFFSLFVQELSYLGDKVFGKRRDDLIHAEVNNLVRFLKPIAMRTIGDHNDLDFEGKYCRFGIMIVGKPNKLLLSLEPYIVFIRKRLAANSVDTIYLLARSENLNRMRQLAGEFVKNYEVVREMKFKKILKHAGHIERASQCLLVLRRIDIDIIQSSQTV